MKGLCGQVVIPQEDFQILCSEWIQIAFSVCLEKMTKQTSKPIWTWMWNFLPFFSEQSTEVETSYDFYNIKPNNLTIAECGDLMKETFKEFLNDNFGYIYSGIFNSTMKPLPEDKMWLSDFFLYINIFLMLSWIISWIFLLRINNDEGIEENTRIDNADGSTQAVINPEEALTPATVDENVEDSNSMKTLIFDGSNVPFDSSETTSGGSVSIITSIYESLSSCASSTPLEANKKASKNFLNINMEQVKQKSALVAHTPRLCCSEEKVEKAQQTQKSLIPVRVKPSAKKQDEKNSSDC